MIKCIFIWLAVLSAVSAGYYYPGKTLYPSTLHFTLFLYLSSCENEKQKTVFGWSVHSNKAWHCLFVGRD